MFVRKSSGSLIMFLLHYDISSSCIKEPQISVIRDPGEARTVKTLPLRSRIVMKRQFRLRTRVNLVDKT